MKVRLTHELTDKVFVGLGNNCVKEGEPEADITICNGFFHFKPRNNGQCQVTACECRDRQNDRDCFSDHLYHSEKHDFANQQQEDEL